MTGVGGLSLAPTAGDYSNNTNAGTATAKATPMPATPNHTGSSQDSKNFTIDPASSTTTGQLPGERDVRGDGSAQTPCSVTVTGAGGLSLEHRLRTYSNNTNAGTATASYTYAGDAKPYGDRATRRTSPLDPGGFHDDK